MTNGSSTSPKADQSKQAPPTPELCGGTTGFVMMIVMMLTIFIMFSPDLRFSIANGLDVAFYPIFGFGGKYPALTLVFSAIFMVFCSTLIRHYMTDWIGIARAQKIMSGIQKEKSDAMLKGDTLKLKKLEEFNPEMTKYQMELMTSNLKPIAFTMIFFIIVFPWIWAVFIPGLDYQFLTLPGTSKWYLLGSLDFCFGFQSWILVYIVLSFPIGFLIQNGLKYISFSRKIKKTELEQQDKIDDRISELETELSQAKNKGMVMDRSRELLAQAQQSLTEKKYTRASSQVDDAKSYLERKFQSHERTTNLITEAETMLKNAERKGVGVADSAKSLDFARKALKRNDETSAIYYAKQCQRQIKESRKAHKDAEDSLSSVKAILYDLREMNTDEADEIFNQAEKAMVKKKYSEVIKYSKSTKLKAEEIKNLNSDADERLKAVKNSIDSIQHLGLQISGVNEQLAKATQARDKHKYSEAIELADKLLDRINAEKDKFQNAQESVSFAKLVISNAQSFGADVRDAENLLNEAERALIKKDYDSAISAATKAKDIAEQGKRQAQRDKKRI